MTSKSKRPPSPSIKSLALQEDEKSRRFREAFRRGLRNILEKYREPDSDDNLPTSKLKRDKRDEGKTIHPQHQMARKLTKYSIQLGFSMCTSKGEEVMIFVTQDQILYDYQIEMFTLDAHKNMIVSQGDFTLLAFQEEQRPVVELKVVVSEERKFAAIFLNVSLIHV